MRLGWRPRDNQATIRRQSGDNQAALRGHSEGTQRALRGHSDGTQTALRRHSDGTQTALSHLRVLLSMAEERDQTIGDGELVLLRVHRERRESAARLHARARHGARVSCGKARRILRRARGWGRGCWRGVWEGGGREARGVWRRVCVGRGRGRGVWRGSRRLSPPPAPRRRRSRAS